MKVHFSSASPDWSTPKDVYDALDAEFYFNDDPCPLFGADRQNGLLRPWGSRTFCNPPSGREIGKWTRKAIAEAKESKTVVLLIPSRTDTKWWHEIMDFMVERDEIRFCRGRLKFGNAKHGAPFPSAVVVLRSRLLGDTHE
jgi:hypothetical protein